MLNKGQDWISWQIIQLWKTTSVSWHGGYCCVALIERQCCFSPHTDNGLMLFWCTLNLVLCFKDSQFLSCKLFWDYKWCNGRCKRKSIALQFVVFLQMTQACDREGQILSILGQLHFSVSEVAGQAEDDPHWRVSARRKAAPRPIKGPC